MQTKAGLERVQREIKGRESLQTASLDSSVRALWLSREHGSEWTREINIPEGNFDASAMNLKNLIHDCLFFSTHLCQPESWWDLTW